MTKYDNNYFQSILNLKEQYRLNDAIKDFQKYITLYPNDPSGFTYYADALICDNRLDDAIPLLEYSENLIKENSNILDLQNYLMIKIKLLIHQKRYEEAYNFVKSNFSNISNKNYIFSIKRVLIFLKKKLNILSVHDVNDNYFFSQIITYSEKDALEHINKHLLINESSRYVKDFPLEKVYYEIRELLPNEVKYNKGIETESYIFKYDANGYFENKLVNYIEVITLLESQDILTMYPYENKEKRRFTDINPVINDDFKLERKSRIAKFYERYGIK